MSGAARIHVGVGGWTYEPWRVNFYPKGLPHRKELAHASRRLTALEVNGTFYSTFGPSQFAKWREETPQGFMFSLKAHRFTTHRRQLAGAGEGVQRFIGSGIAQLRERLGPIVWQLMPTTRFDAQDVGAFLALLPQEVDGLPLRHVLEPRHASFCCEAYLELAHRHGCSTVYADSDEYPAIADAGGDLAYLRLMRSTTDCETGYRPQALDRWAAGAHAWVTQGPRKEAFIFFISGAKERNPAAAMALLERLQGA